MKDREAGTVYSTFATISGTACCFLPFCGSGQFEKSNIS